MSRKKSKPVETGKFNTKLWLIAGSDELRPAMALACFIDGYVYVTDAHLAIKQSLTRFHKLDEEQAMNLNGKFIHKDVLKELDKFQTISYETDCITAKKEIAGNIMTVKFNYTECDNYPNVGNVIDAAMNREKGTDVVNQISFNPKLMNRLYDAMNPKFNEFSINGIIIEFVAAGRAIGVTLNSSDFNRNENFGIIMPCMIND